MWVTKSIVKLWDLFLKNGSAVNNEKTGHEFLLVKILFNSIFPQLPSAISCVNRGPSRPDPISRLSILFATAPVILELAVYKTHTLSLSHILVLTLTIPIEVCSHVLLHSAAKGNPRSALRLACFNGYLLNLNEWTLRHNTTIIFYYSSQTKMF